MSTLASVRTPVPPRVWLGIVLVGAELAILPK